MCFLRALLRYVCASQRLFITWPIPTLQSLAERRGRIETSGEWRVLTASEGALLLELCFWSCWKGKWCLGLSSGTHIAARRCLQPRRGLVLAFSLLFLSPLSLSPPPRCSLLPRAGRPRLGPHQQTADHEEQGSGEAEKGESPNIVYLFSPLESLDVCVRSRSQAAWRKSKEGSRNKTKKDAKGERERDLQIGKMGRMERQRKRDGDGVLSPRQPQTRHKGRLSLRLLLHAPLTLPWPCDRSPDCIPRSATTTIAL